MKFIYCLLSALTVSFAASAAAPSLHTASDEAVSQEKTEKKESKVKTELQNHFKFYGFIRNYFAFDTRESASGTKDLFYYMPLDRDINEEGEDLNAAPSFRFLAITTRLGVDVSGYRIGKTDFGAKVETDFYCMNGSTAVLRMRQAYVSLGWNDLPLSANQKASVSLKIGQAWHPMAADLPDVFSLASGAPFNPFNRSPQVTMDANLGKNFTLTGSFIYQMQYTSNGPKGPSSDYMMYGIAPEFYAGLTYKTGGFLARAGVSVLSLKPRIHAEVPDAADPAQNHQVKVSERMTSLTPFIYLQYKHNLFALKAKTTYAGAADHLNQVCGYGVTAMHDGEGEDHHWEYAPTRVSSTWLSLSYGNKVKGILMGGYLQRFGANKDFVDLDHFYNFQKGGNFKKLASVYRIVPAVTYNVGKFTLGLEYELTSAQYGAQTALNGGVTGDLHWITNHRVQAMVKFTF